MTPKQQANIITRLVAEQVAKQAEKWRTQTAQQMYAILLTILHDKWGFGAEQLVKVFEQIVDQFNCINDKYVKIEDFYALLADMGIKVVDKEGKV